jgi:hypothetical protein
MDKRLVHSRPIGDRLHPGPVDALGDKFRPRRRENPPAIAILPQCRSISHARLTRLSLTEWFNCMVKI